MGFIAFSLISALALSIRNLAGKAGVEKQDPYIVAWATNFFSLPIAVVAVLIFGFEIKDPGFWLLLPIRITMDVVALLCLLNAFKFKSVSYIIPLLSVTPIFTIFFAFLLRGETISTIEILAIFIIVLACLIVYKSEYNLTEKPDRKDLIKATFLVLITALLYSILDPLHPMLIERSNPFTYSLISTIIFTSVFTCLVLWKSKRLFSKVFTDRKLFMLNSAVGLSLGFEVLFFFLALSIAPAVALVSSLRESSVALTSVGGFVLLKEKNNVYKTLGIIGTILGVVIIAFSAQ